MEEIRRPQHQVNRENRRVCQGDSRLSKLHHRRPDHSAEVRMPGNTGRFFIVSL